MPARDDVDVKLILKLLDVVLLTYELTDWLTVSFIVPSFDVALGFGLRAWGFGLWASGFGLWVLGFDVDVDVDVGFGCDLGVGGVGFELA